MKNYFCDFASRIVFCLNYFQLLDVYQTEFLKIETFPFFARIHEQNSPDFVLEKLYFLCNGLNYYSGLSTLKKLEEIHRTLLTQISFHIFQLVWPDAPPSSIKRGASWKLHRPCRPFHCQSTDLTLKLPSKQ